MKIRSHTAVSPSSATRAHRASLRQRPGAGVWLHQPNAFTWAVASAFVLPLMGQPAAYAQALPTGAVVTQGGASIATSVNKMTVTNTPGTNINWQSFNIGAGKTVQFVQQDGASMVFNRVTSSTPSSILGSLISNGKVFLINPNGVTIGHGAYIDTAAFVASSLGIKTEDLMAGKFKFENGAGSGKIANYGTIVTQSGGFVYFVGKDVENHGVIHTPKGEIILAAGNSVEIINPKSPALRVEITANGNEAVNLGKLIASGGTIGMFAGNVRHSGVAQASTAEVNAQGRIVFRAKQNVTLDAGSRTEASGPTAGKITIQSENGTATVQGSVEAIGTATPKLEQNLPQSQTGITLARENTLTITPDLNGNGVSALLGKVNIFATPKTVAASASPADGTVTAAPTNAPGKGGRVEILAPAVVLDGPALVDASGDTGGGTILVGGDLQGKNPDVPNAKTTFVGTDVILRADALLKGDGGKVIVWADAATHFVASISARGGRDGGNGGFAEVSGKDFLYFNPRGSIDLSAPQGATGILLLDPADVNITTGTDTLSGAFDAGNPNIYGISSATSEITWATINTNLGTANIIITTSDSGASTGAGNITVVNGFTYNRANSLTLLANNNITVNSGASITNSGTGNISFLAGWTGNNAAAAASPVLAGAATISILGNAAIVSNGAINLTAGATGSVLTNGGVLNLTGSSVTVVGAINTTNTNVAGGAVNLSATGTGGGISIGAVTASGTGVSSGNGRAGGAVTLRTSNGSINASGITSTGSAGVAGTGGAGGIINITSAGASGNITIGSITINGDAAIDNGASAGGAGGTVNLTASGTATVGGINSTGGAGANDNTPGEGGIGGNVTILAANLVTVSSNIITTAGAAGTDTDSNAVNPVASGVINISSSAGGINLSGLTSNGALGGVATGVDTNGANGGGAATITVVAAGAINLSAVVSASGGTGGTGTGTGDKGGGGNAATVTIASTGGAVNASAGINATGGAIGAVGSGGAPVVGNGAAINITGTNITAGPLNTSGTASSLITVNEAGTGTQTGVFTGSALTKSGVGKFTLSQVNLYSGITTVSGGTLSFSADNQLGTGTGAGNVTLNGGTLEANASVTLAAARGIALGASGGSLAAVAANTLTYGGVIAGGTGVLNITGAGVVSLGGNSSYTTATNAQLSRQYLPRCAPPKQSPLRMQKARDTHPRPAWHERSG